jgi:CubicO group peptidase (beta-lactamase class C family)
MKSHTHLIPGLALAAIVLVAAGPAPFKFPDTVAGQRAAAYIEAFNTGREDAVRTFLAANLAKAALAQRSIEDRISTYRDMRDAHGKLTPVELLNASGDQIAIRARDGHDEVLDLAFVFEPEAPNLLMGLRVAIGGPGAGPGGQGPAPATPLPEDQAVAAWKTFLDSLSRADAFSGAVLLTRGDQVLLRSAYGYASREDKTPNRVDTRFNLGSINKILTKLAIAQLVEQGKVKLDDTIDHYLPDYPKAAASKVTVRQLLEHRGGVGDIFGETYEHADKSKLRRVADWIPLFRDKPLAFEPGTRQAYSNGGYVLLGAVIEKASGEDYYDYMRRHVYGPLGMTSTDHYAKDDKVANLATGYTKQHLPRVAPAADGFADNDPTRPMRGSPAGGGYSTLDDLLAFTRAIRAGRLLRPETVSRGFGDLGVGPGGEAGLGIGGGAPGINAAIEMSGPYTIIVLANLDPPAAEGAASRMRGWLPAGAGGRQMIRIGAGDRSGAEHGGPEPGAGGGHGGGEPVHRAESPERTSVPAAGVEVEMGRILHLPAVNVMINGQGPFRFALDTGAAGSARIDSAVAAKLGLEKIGQARSGDPSGLNMHVMDLVRIGTLEIGGARFEGMSAAVHSSNERRLAEEADGILGFALFKNCLLTLDYPANRLRVDRGELPAPNGGDVIAFTSEQGIPLVRLRVDSLTVDAHVDAGSMGGLSLPIALAEKLPLASPLRTVGRGRTVSNEFEIKAAELNGTASLGGQEFSHPTIDFQPIFPFANVGSRVLRDFRVTFDQKNGRMRLTRPQ